MLVLKNGNWALIYNDLERDRQSLAVSLSEDEGRTWRWMRHLERDADTSDPQRRAQYHYPSIIQAGRRGTLHATYSYFAAPAIAQKDAEGRLARKAIKDAGPRRRSCFATAEPTASPGNGSAWTILDM
jgi:hypothetical protein